MDAGASALPQVVKPRQTRVRRARPSGLPNGRVRQTAAREFKVRRRVRPKRLAATFAPMKTFSPSGDDPDGSTAGARLLDFGGRLGRWSNKCLQTSVLGLCRDSAKDVLRARLLRTCSNDLGSGFAGGAKEARNFYGVQKVLRSVGKRVRVLDIRCCGDFWGGLWLGSWWLGSAREQILGTLVWSRLEQHVFVACCEGMQQ